MRSKADTDNVSCCMLYNTDSNRYRSSQLQSQVVLVRVRIVPFSLDLHEDHQRYSASNSKRNPLGY